MGHMCLFLWSAKHSKSPLTWSRFFVAVTLGSSVSRPSCYINNLSLLMHPFIQKQCIFSRMICRIYIQHCVWWYDGLGAPVVSFCELRVVRWELGHQSLRFRTSSVSHGFMTKTNLLHFLPQSWRLPNRLWAPMLQESHELTANLNYKVSFLQRSAFVSF